MKLIGDLKNKVEKANSKEEAKDIISKAGMSLTNEELDLVVGGDSIFRSSYTEGFSNSNNVEFPTNMRDPQFHSKKDK